MEDAGVEVQTDFIRGAQGIQGDKGEQGEKGDKGDKGDKGEAFTYNDLTPEQIEELRQQLYEGLITQDEMDIILGGIDTNLNTMQDNIEAEMGLKSVKREFQITFDDGLENAKCNIELGALATYNGHLKIELVGNYLNGNYIGLIERHFDILVVNNELTLQEGQYTYASEKASQAFAVPRIYVGSDGVVKIQVCSLTTVKKRCTLLVTMYADNISYLDVLKNAKLSNVFTSDATTYPKANALERYTGSLDDINRTCILCGAPATGYPSGAGNGWGYISTMKYSDIEMFQMYFDKITGTIFYRFKQSNVWGGWKDLSYGAISKTLLNYAGDLNDINETGIVYAATDTNVPEGSGYGYCTTLKMGTNYMVQYYEKRTNKTTYKRFKEAGTWGDWELISGPTTVNNDNGTATKFPDGTMICRGTVNCEANSASVVATFPEPFKNESYAVNATPMFNATAYVTVSCSYKTKESVTLYPRVDKNNVTYSQKIDYIAIGRWK